MGVSIHATLAGGDSGGVCSFANFGCFYPRHPRGWRRDFRQCQQHGVCVSIHATLAGGDQLLIQHGSKEIVSIHATLAGGDCLPSSPNSSRTKFLSTPPSRVATTRKQRTHHDQSCFYPRHPRGWRLGNRKLIFTSSYVSIHATLAGGDNLRRWPPKRRLKFLSTPPSRVATI